MSKHRAVKRLRTLVNQYPEEFQEHHDLMVQGLRNPDAPTYSPISGVDLTRVFAGKLGDFNPFQIAKGRSDRVSDKMISDSYYKIAVGPWRFTQSIYRFDEDLLKSISTTPVSGDLPCDLLRRIPEWGIYVDLTPASELHGIKAYGFWANVISFKGCEELRVSLDVDGDNFLFPLIVRLGDWSLEEAVLRPLSDIDETAKSNGVELTSIDGTTWAGINMTSISEPLVSIVLYICSDGVEYRDSERPSKPSVRTNRMFPEGMLRVPSEPRVWRLGEKTGKAIREARAAGKCGSAKAPHIRRAHWHRFWKGPMDGDRELVAKFIAPTLVGARI